nr:erythromycin esterase family protein [Actinomadura graeca]
MRPLPPSRRRFLAASLLAVPGVPATRAAAADGRPGPVPALDRHARPLRSTEPSGGPGDLRALGRAVGGAAVVGAGEATHGSHEFFTMKHRIFRHLVGHHGFTTFAIESSWSTGLRLDDYVVHGTGDPRAIIEEEFGSRVPWSTREFLDMLLWMRACNARGHRRVRFMGDDLNYPTLGTELAAKVTGYVRDRHPAHLPGFEARYRDLRGVKDGDAYMALSVAERQKIAGQAAEAHGLLARLRPSSGAGPSGRASRFEWTLQHARSLVHRARPRVRHRDPPARRHGREAPALVQGVRDGQRLAGRGHVGRDGDAALEPRHVRHPADDPAVRQHHPHRDAKLRRPHLRAGDHVQPAGVAERAAGQVEDEARHPRVEEADGLGQDRLAVAQVDLGGEHQHTAGLRALHSRYTEVHAQPQGRFLTWMTVGGTSLRL